MSSLFEADSAVSQAADTHPTDFSQTVLFFEEQNELLAQYKDELILRVAKAKQRCSQDAPGEDTGRLASEIKELRAKLAKARHEREAAGAAAEALNGQIKAIKATKSSFGRQVTEKKGVQNILLAINGLQLADVAENRCEFVYDTFSKVHLDTAAEFTSLHPEIDWSAIIRDSIDSTKLNTRQYAISVMKTNSIIKELLEDVKRVKRRTFVEILYNGGIQVRMQFFSKDRRLRFYLHVPLATIDAYRPFTGIISQLDNRGCLWKCGWCQVQEVSARCTHQPRGAAAFDLQPHRKLAGCILVDSLLF
ncbi:hypothetical protein BX661DRAFT_96102 [Kickxella alabastrina]|uniref:uncharacterized protein n=1 Tax=Kickxella alabastrina TaxID=61397 RepID=UPI002220C031|nr:uncharacterized protein BX661DRAFT_96102 [Kickxella alabastrina]KAI7829994.1 hypothetical protein BX661DRAFT_96102 [Kickxella alabastrina]